MFRAPAADLQEMHDVGSASPASPTRGRSAVAMAAWLAALALAMSLLARYHGAAGDPGATPSAWPVTEPRLAPGGLEIVLFVHPRCPCTVRSIDAAATLLRTLEDLDVAFAVRVVIRTPGADGDDGAATRDEADGPDREDAWHRSPTIRRLDRLGPSQRQFDPGGAIAARWQAVTSGHVAIFDAAGRRLLDGGLTPARSHAEDLAVLRAIAERLADGLPVASRPVFGCPIPDPGTPDARASSSVSSVTFIAPAAGSPRPLDHAQDPTS